MRIPRADPQPHYELPQGTDLVAAGSIVRMVQQAIEVPDRVGLPPKVRVLKRMVEHHLRNQLTTMVVDPEHVAEVFGLLGYPVERAQGSL